MWQLWGPTGITVLTPPDGCKGRVTGPDKLMSYQRRRSPVQQNKQRGSYSRLCLGLRAACAAPCFRHRIDLCQLRRSDSGEGCKHRPLILSRRVQGPKSAQSVSEAETGYSSLKLSSSASRGETLELPAEERHRQLSVWHQGPGMDGFHRMVISSHNVISPDEPTNTELQLKLG